MIVNVSLRGGGASLLVNPATTSASRPLAFFSSLLFSFLAVTRHCVQAQAQQLTSFDLNDPASYGPALDAVTALAAAAGGSGGGGEGGADCTGRLQWMSDDFATSSVLLPCGRVIEAHTAELEDSSYDSSGSDDPFGVNSACAECLGSVGTVLVPRMLAVGLNPTDPTLAGSEGGEGQCASFPKETNHIRSMIRTVFFPSPKHAAAKKAGSHSKKKKKTHYLSHPSARRELREKRPCS